MATRNNTIEYAWAHINTATAEASVYTSGDITINIPENTSRTFTSVLLDVVVVDDQAAGALDISAMNIGASCDAGTTWTDRNVTTTLADTGENMSFHLWADVTAEFTARFSGTSDTCRFRLQMDYSGVGINYLNIAAKVVITYEYSDAGQTTRIKTVRIPLESLTSRPAAATPTEIGTNQIPALDTFLPEASITYRAIFAEIWLNTAPAGTTDGTLTLDLNTTPTMTTAAIKNGNQSPLLMKIMWDLLAAAMTTNAAHAIRFTGNTTAMGIAVGGWVTVTYEYNHSTSTTILNSMILPADCSSYLKDGSGDMMRWAYRFLLEEPATITLVQSALVVHATLTSTASTLSIKCGAQAARTYTLTQQAGQAGGVFVVHRIDSGGAQGAGATLARGEVTLTADVYESVANAINNASGFYILNYTSGVAAGGAITHRRSIMSIVKDTQAALAPSFTASWSLNIPETDYWLDGVLFDVNSNQSSSIGLWLAAEEASGEGLGAGFKTLGFTIIAMAERLFAHSFFQSQQFNRYPADPRDIMDIETSRTILLYSGLNNLCGVVAWATYHSITFAETRAETNYTGDGSGITVDIFRVDTNEWLYRATSVAGGNYVITMYDNALSYFSATQQDSAHVGRSANWTPT